MEDFNLRSAIVAYAATHNALGGAIPAKHKDQLAANDVKWSHGRFDTTICTAAANGQIVIYDVTRAGVEFARLHEHVRQVHRVAFNPHQGALLLSGSQDATMRLWDLRDLAGDRSIMTCRSSYQYPGNNEGIRDLRWSPMNGVEFAAGTDNGVIQRWDLRKPKAPILKVNAHEKTCHSIDWHPDGKHLLSGGADKMVNVWDFSSTDRRKKACWQLRAPQAVLNVRWRPPRWYPPGRTLGNWQCSQIVTSYDYQDPRIHVWDFRRPYMPLREFDCYDTAPAAMLWRSEDLLWSVGTRGIFTQTDINFATQVSDTRSTSMVAIAPNGQIGMFSGRRARRSRPLQDATEDFLDRQRGSSGGGEKMSRSHSATDGSFEEASLLSSSLKKRHRKPPSMRSSKSVASTPPSVGTGASAVNFEEAMQKEFAFQPTQAAGYGRIIGLFDPAAFAFLARNYKSSPIIPSAQLADGSARMMSKNFQFNARLAAGTYQYRLAQSWRVLSLAVEKEFEAWTSIYGSKRRSILAPSNLDRGPNLGNPHRDACYTGADHETTTSASEITRQRRELVTLQTLDHSSNITTPIAQPIVHNTTRLVGSECSSISIGDGNFLLPAPAGGYSIGDSQTDAPADSPGRNDQLPLREKARKDVDEEKDTSVSRRSSTSEMSFTKSADIHLPMAGFPDLDPHLSERRAAIENYKAAPRPLLRLEELVHTGPENVTLSSQLYDSADRFQLFSTSTDSSQQVHSITGSSRSSPDSERMGMAPERWDASVRPGTGSEAFQGKTNLDKDAVSQPLKDRLFPSVGAENHSSQIGPSQPPVNRVYSQGLRSLPLNRSPPSERPIVNFDEMEHLGELEKPRLASSKEATPKNEISNYGEGLPNMTDGRPWAAASIIDMLITYHATELCSSQLPANILLQLGPLSKTICPALVLSILLSYHAQLTSLSLFVQAAYLRNQAYPRYPEVSDHGNYGISPGGPWCVVCQKPSKGNRRRFCQSCNQPWADCPICNGEGTAAVTHDTHVQQSDSLWGWCQWCGHGGHLGCLRVWWQMPTTSEGGCATTGCLHDCVAGARREEVHKRKVAAKKASTVRSDEWVVGESRAVERTRSMVRGPGEDGGSPGGVHGSLNAKALRGPQGPLSLGMMGRSGSGGKKVRLLAPIEDDGVGKTELETEDGESRAGETGTSASAP